MFKVAFLKKPKMVDKVRSMQVVLQKDGARELQTDKPDPWLPVKSKPMRKNADVQFDENDKKLEPIPEEEAEKTIEDDASAKTKEVSEDNKKEEEENQPNITKEKLQKLYASLLPFRTPFVSKNI